MVLYKIMLNFKSSHEWKINGQLENSINTKSI